MTVTNRPCEICNQPIEAERLEALPETRLCIAHAHEAAKYGGEFTVTATWERTSKTGSLKKNYGGVNPRKRRNQKAVDQLRADWNAADAEKK